MSRLSRCSAPLLAGLVLLSSSREAVAAPCGRPDVDLTFPPNDATSVPSNALFSAHYAAPALYNDEPVSVTDADGNAVNVTVTYDDAESTLRAAPDQALSAGKHEIVWPGLRGVSGSGGLGRGDTTSFVVQSSPDTSPPSFSGLSGISWDLARDRDPCLDRLDDRFVFKLQLGAGTDDSGTELLSLLVFETRDPSAPGPGSPTKVALQAWPHDGALEVRRPASKAGETCFAAVAQDLVGNVSGGGEREVCAKTKLPPFFEGCAVAALGPGATQQLGGLWLATLAGLALVRLRRRRALHALTPRAV